MIAAGVNAAAEPSVRSTPRGWPGDPPPGPVGDGPLVAAMLAGSPTAFDRLFRIHVASVRRVAASVARSPESAEDLVQEVFVFLWRHGDRYDCSRGGLGPWLRTIARNRALDLLRAEVRDERLVVSAAGESRTVACDPGPLDATIAAERAACVRAALDLLPRAQRQAMLLSYGAGLTDLQVARISGVPLGTVKSRLRLSKQQLAGRLAREGMAGALPGA